MYMYVLIKLQVMETSPGTFYQRPEFRCSDLYLDFINFRVGANLHLLELEGVEPKVRNPNNVTRGIVMAAYDEILPSTYAVIRQIRRTGCELPIELWSRKLELQTLPLVLSELVEHYNVVLRKIKDADAEGFLVKVHAIEESHFDEVLFLDGDNVPIRDPTYLFDTQEFKENGAIFWPDYWHPRYSIFDMGAGGLAWELFGVDFEDEMEQESGQVLIDRQRNAHALSLMIYYAKHFSVVKKLRAVWGDKDLFRLSFKRTNSKYYMIPTFPALAGRLFGDPLRSDGSQFCGQTIVQHDPDGAVLFLHRNTAKLSTPGGRIPMWQAIQRYTGTDRGSFTVKMGPKRMHDTCFYLPHTAKRSRMSNPVDQGISVQYERMPFHEIETHLINDVERLDKENNMLHYLKSRFQKQWQIAFLNARSF